MSQTIESRIVKTAPVAWRSFRFVQQDNFKEFTAAAEQKLTGSLLGHHFVQAFNVWEDGAGEVWCLDGRHRVRVLEQLAAAGNTVPELLPANFLQCADLQEAAKLTLLYSSAYARTTEQGLLDFLDQHELNLGDLAGQIDLPSIDLDKLLGNLEPALTPAKPQGALAERFGVPPFSVLDARQGYWQERKNYWLGQGIASVEGRGEELTFSESARPPAFYELRNAMRAQAGGVDPSWEEVNAEAARRGMVSAAVEGTSIFDPVVCELAYRWFCPEGGHVLDPFAGGSVRGLVAAALGYAYTGIDLRPEQVAANERQLAQVAPRLPAMLARRVLPADADPGLTPIEQHGAYYVKREDHYRRGGVNGSKVRALFALLAGKPGVVAYGARQSPHPNRVAHVCRALGIPCRLHVAAGARLPEWEAAAQAGAELVEHKAGYLNVLAARARTDAAERGWYEVPFGAVCETTAALSAEQVGPLPEGVRRLVVPVGSGISLAGVLHGLARTGQRVPVLGVCVGQPPTDTLDAYAPADWREWVTLVESPLKYEQPAPECRLGPVALDPIYEAKCLPYLQAGDLLWIVGIRQTADPAAVGEPAAFTPPTWLVGDSRHLADLVPAEQLVDFVFSCPPYADLEVYSDDPADLSTMNYPDFVEAYRQIIAQAVARLRPNRFACFVVGEVRDPKGIYRNFVGDTIAAFEAAGARYYNEGILVTQAGSLAIRAGRVFQSGRKLGKSHQNVLVFFNGDPRQIKNEFGDVPVTVGLGDADADLCPDP